MRMKITKPEKTFKSNLRFNTHFVSLYGLLYVWMSMNVCVKYNCLNNILLKCPFTCIIAWYSLQVHGYWLLVMMVFLLRLIILFFLHHHHHPHLFHILDWLVELVHWLLFIFADFCTRHILHCFIVLLLWDNTYKLLEIF